NHVPHDETSSEQHEQTENDIVDESQLQMLQVDDEGETTMRMTPQNQEDEGVEEKGSASVAVEESMPEHHSITSVPTLVSQDKDEFEQAHAEQGTLLNETS